MAYRYFSTVPLPSGETAYPVAVTLEGDEAHHLIHVMRVKEGEPLILFDGSGAEFDAEITQVRKPCARISRKKASVSSVAGASCGTRVLSMSKMIPRTPFFRNAS